MTIDHDLHADVVTRVDVGDMLIRTATGTIQKNVLRDRHRKHLRS